MWSVCASRPRQHAPGSPVFSSWAIPPLLGQGGWGPLHPTSHRERTCRRWNLGAPRGDRLASFPLLLGSFLLGDETPALSLSDQVRAGERAGGELGHTALALSAAPWPSRPVRPAHLLRGQSRLCQDVAGEGAADRWQRTGCRSQGWAGDPGSPVLPWSTQHAGRGCLGQVSGLDSSH